MRIVQAGLGFWGRSCFQDVLRRYRGAEVVGFVEPSEQALSAARAEGGIPPERCFTSLDDALEAVEADALVVTASLAGHLPLCRAGLAAGLHVLVESGRPMFGNSFPAHR